MLRAERKHHSPLRRNRLSSCQRGSVLLGIIITMVVMAALGAGMVYLTTTSTFQELVANNNMRAYYAAESGARYVNARIREILTGHGGSISQLKTDLCGTSCTDDNNLNNDIIFTMSNNEKFQITRWTDNNPAPGTGISWAFEYDVVGTVGSGFIQAKRKLTYKINPADQGDAPVPPPIPPEASEFQVPQGQQAAAWLSQYYDPTGASDTKIFVQSAGGDAALNLAATDYTMGLKWFNNLQLAQLDAIRATNNNLLSYGVQVKIWEDENVDYSEMIGISFRLDDYAPAAGTSYEENMYGISFIKLKTKPDKNPSPAWYANYIWSNNDNDWNVFSNTPSRWFVVLWKRVYYDPDGEGTQPLNWYYTPLAYQQIPTGTGTVCQSGDSNGCITLKPWSTLMIYIKEFVSGGTRSNKITGYLASPDVYVRRTITPNNLATQPILWGEDDAGNIKNTGTFQRISWTVIGDTVLDPSPYVILNGSLTTLNYNNANIGIITDKAREIGLHVFTSNEGANKIFYDNFYIDLTPSDYGYADGNGRVIQYP